ncbi:MAG: hypothetical protein ABEJ91_01560 [Candidatus Nanohaloarchaea archaeon]
MAVEHLLEPAHRKIQEKAAGAPGASVERNKTSTSLVYQEDNLEKEVSAWYDENDMELKVLYSAHQEYGIEGREERVRLEKSRMVAQIPHEGKEVKDAVEQAYNLSRKVTEDDLEDAELLEKN